MQRSKILRASLEVLTLLFLLGHAALISFSYGALPSTIPTHFDFGGQADAFGPKRTLWYVWFISLGLYGLFSLLGNLPLSSPLWNLPDRVKRDRSGRGRQLVDDMLAAFKALIAGILMQVTWSSLRTAWGNENSWLTPVLIAISVIFPLLILGSFIARAARTFPADRDT